MFCADYVASFVVHTALTLLLLRNRAKDAGGKQNDFREKNSDSTARLWARAAVGCNHRHDMSPNTQLLVCVPFLHGGVAGLGGALAIAPLDFVRQGMSSSNTMLGKMRMGMSTVPYSAAFFGIYFSARTPDDLSSQVKWACGAAGSAVLAEAPFDKTKRILFGGSNKMLIGANLLYVPFAAMMLIMYDKAIQPRTAVHYS